MPVKGKKSLPIDAELHKIISKAAIDREMHVYQLLWEMWRAYQDAQRQARAAEVGASEKQAHAEYHDLLDIVLAAGGDEATTIRTLLRTYADKARVGKRKQTKAG